MGAARRARILGPQDEPVTCRPIFESRSSWVSERHDDTCQPNHRRPLLSAEIIGHAVWRYFRFPLRLRMVGQVLAACASSSAMRPGASGH